MPVSVFSLFLCFTEKGISNGVQTSWKFTVIFYEPEETHGASEMDQRSPEAATRVESAPPALPLSRGPTWRETDAKNSYKYQNPRKGP